MSQRLAHYRLSWPRLLDEGRVGAFFRALAADAAPGPVVLDVRSDGGQLQHVLSLPTGRAEATVRLLTLAVPGIRAERLTDIDLAVQRALLLQLSSRRRAVRTDAPADTAATILAALAGTRHGERLHLQWVLGPRLRPVAVPNNFVDFKRTSSLGAVMSAPFSPPGKVDPEARTALRDKQSLAGWRVIARIGVTAGSPEREQQLLRQLLSALRFTESPALRLNARSTRPRKLAEQSEPWFWPSVLNEREIVGLSAWPLGELNTPGLTRSAFTMQAAASTVPRTGRIIGDVIASGRSRPVALNAVDAARHALLLGPTGTGKSTLMGQLALADAHDGRGVILVDNRRDLVDDILARLPAERLDDVVVLDPSGGDSVVGFNPLAATAAEAPLVADRLVGIFKRIYGTDLGPRSEDILHAGLLTLALAGGQTMPALPLLFSNPEFRRQVTGGLDDPLGLGSFWAWFEGISDAERRAATAPLGNKLRLFLSRPALRRALGQTSPRFLIRQVFTERKILLVNLAKGDLGPETAQLFGALLLNEVWQQTLARAAIAPERRHLVMLHVDEFHEYLRLPTPFADVLVAARGYGLGLSIATQHLDQLTPDVRSAVLGNTGSRVAFRLSDNDAKVMARDSAILTADDFQGLGAYEAYASLMAGGARTPYASIATRPFGPRLRDPAVVRRASAERWGLPATQVDAELRLLVSQPVGPTQPNAALGRRRRDGGSA